MTRGAALCVVAVDAVLGVCTGCIPVKLSGGADHLSELEGRLGSTTVVIHPSNSLLIQRSRYSTRGTARVLFGWLVLHSRPPRTLHSMCCGRVGRMAADPLKRLSTYSGDLFGI